MNVFLVACVCCCFTVVQSYRMFRDEIPNGDNVPNPCVTNTKWKAPGHINILGGGDRNPFGMDFDQAGRTWTEALCRKDSDGDGDTNGQELGDPNCKWTKQSGPPEITLLNSLSHPGICEPMGSKKCEGKNKDGICKQKAKYECDFDALGPDNGVSAVTVQLTEKEVPAKETTYICQSFNLQELLPDSTKPYHIIGSEPILVNENVMHHIILYGCDSDDDANIARLREPGECGMATSSACSSSLGGWTVGSVGDCILGDYGTRIGANTFKYVILEMHWNNPLLTRGSSDSSGIKLHITSNLRRNDLGSMVVGPIGLRLEPGKDRIEQIGTCSAQCTRQILRDREINVVAVENHMHYLGIEAHLELIRDGKVTALGIDPQFEYDTPVSHGHYPPIVIKSGDEIRLKCVYKTTLRNNVVYYGDGTQAEMCFGFITFYPNILTSEEAACLDWGGIDTCSLAERMANVNCDETTFFEKASTYTQFENITTHCQQGSCSETCLDTLRNWYETESCLSDPSIRELIIYDTGLIQSDGLPGEYLAGLMRVCNKEYNNKYSSTGSVMNYTIAIFYTVVFIIVCM